MAYDFVRWGIGIVIFVAVAVVLSLITKKKGKSVLIASFAAIMIFAVLLLVPVENFVYGFPTVEKAFSYRYHEKLVSYAECDEGVLCIAQKDENNFNYYTFEKKDGKIKLPKFEGDKIIYRSSKYGVYMFRLFENQVLIVTQVKDSLYDGHEFSECAGGYYYYYAVDDVINYSKLTCLGEKVTLV